MTHYLANTSTPGFAAIVAYWAGGNEATVCWWFVPGTLIAE
jgi:hypothetical protein